MDEKKQSLMANPGVRTGLKVGVLALLVLLLLIPLSMVSGLVSERDTRSQNAAEELVWQNGGRQVVTSPRLVVPYSYRDDEGEVRRSTLVIRAESVEADAVIEPHLLRRGIYEVPVYDAQLGIAGEVRIPQQVDLYIPEAAVHTIEIAWQRAELVAGISSASGIRTQPRLVVNGTSTETGSTHMGAPGESGVSAALGTIPGMAAELRPGGAFPYKLDLELSGGGSLAFMPLAANTVYRVESTWPDPSFGGAVLPSSRRIDESGFRARWESTAIGMGTPLGWTSASGSALGYGGPMLVELYQPVSIYQQTERSVKYGALFILLPFVALFLLETFTGIRIHPVQYLLVAAAKIVFYLLLLSLSEHLAFSVAYWTGAAATVGLLTVYVLAFTRRQSHGIAIGGMVAAEYLFLFAALQSQDYALLIGSVGLFVVLGGVMLATRRINWYAARGLAAAGPARASGKESD